MTKRAGEAVGKGRERGKNPEPEGVDSAARRLGRFGEVSWRDPRHDPLWGDPWHIPLMGGPLAP